MYENFRWKVITIVLVVLGCAACLYYFDLKKGMDLKGGTELIYQIDVSRLNEKQKAGIQEQAKEVLERRLNILGLQDIKIRNQGRYGLSIHVPVTMDKERVKSIVQRSGKLDFKIVHERYKPLITESANYLESDPNHLSRLPTQDKLWIEEKIQKILDAKQHGTYDEDKNPLDVAKYIYTDSKGKKYGEAYILLHNTPTTRIPGNRLSNAYATTDQYLKPAVGFEYDSVGAAQSLKVTSNNIGRQMAIVLDGVIKSMPTIQAKISDRGIITGRFSKAEVNDLVVILKAGALPARLKSNPTELTTGPELGREAIETGELSIALAFISVFIFMIIYYRWLGLVADVALLLNLLIILAVMALYHADLTLPGIAGILLTVGMSVDANILIFERIREELARGKTLRHAFRQGYDKAFWAIFDANITTLITAVVLFQIGTGPIKGFAVTLSVGILSSLFTALFVTKVIFGIVIVKGWLRKASMLSLLSNPSIPFMKLRRVGVMISLILIVAGMIHLLTVVRGSILGIDFTGGSIIQIKLNHPISTESMRQRVHAMGVQFEDAEVQAVHSEGDSPEGHREYQIRIPHIIKSTPPKIDSKTGQITFYFEIERGKVFPDTLKMLRDLAPRGIVQVLPLEERNSFNWRLSFTTKPLENPDLEVERYRSLIEEYLEGKNFKIVQAETQSQLLKAFAKDLAPKGFPEVKEPFVPYKDTGKGQIRFRVNLDATSSAKPEVIVSALLSESFLEVVNAEKKLAIKPFEREYVQVKVVGGNEYVKEFEILAGLITEREVPLYDAALRTYFKSNRTKTDREGNVLHFVVSEPFPRISQIGPAVAKSLKAKAFWSIVFSILVIIAYITVRFEFTFGIAAIIALIHDLLFTLGLIAAMDYYGILEIKINLPIIAAFLTILGYSLNDTIVIFDRIRENLAQRKRKDSYLEIIDSSLNQTLSRTLLTSFTTFIVVLILFLCGVKVIQGFAFALMVGVVVGTYSSLFIASPVVVFYHLRYERQREKQRLAAATAKKKKK